MTFGNFQGWYSKQLKMPDGGRIVCYYYQNNCGMVSLHDENHNVFRLDAQGQVMWQVQRDDSNHPPDWWEGLHRHAREAGYDGAREPFTYVLLKYDDGTNNVSPQTGDPPNVATWTPDCTIWLQGSAYQQYILDPETGIARNITDWPVRPW